MLSVIMINMKQLVQMQPHKKWEIASLFLVGTQISQRTAHITVPSTAESVYA